MKTPVRKLLACLGAAILAVLPLGSHRAAPFPSQQTKALKKRHKEQRKTLKQQQGAMKRVMAQHEQPSDARRRFRQDLKMQRQMLQRNQKEETRRFKQKHQAAHELHPPN